MSGRDRPGRALALGLGLATAWSAAWAEAGSPPTPPAAQAAPKPAPRAAQAAPKPAPRATASPGPTAPAAESAGRIALWVRHERDRMRPIELDHPEQIFLDLGSLPLEETVLQDAQYGRRMRVRGTALGTLLERLPQAASLDLALLHFANGMVIPLPHRDAAVMKRLEPFVAQAVATPGEALQAGRIPPAPRRGMGRRSAPPVRFVGNKLVVRERWHPEVPLSAQAAFSPWDHADSLVGVELVDGKAWRRQLEVDPAAPVRAGLQRFRGSCQFCHAIRGVGAAMGWDFVEPYPIYSQSWLAARQEMGEVKPKWTLYFHAKYPTSGGAARTMPALKHLRPEDATALWAWLQAVIAHPLEPYQPHPKGSEAPAP